MISSCRRATKAARARDFSTTENLSTKKDALPGSTSVLIAPRRGLRESPARRREVAYEKLLDKETQVERLAEDGARPVS